MSPTLSHYMELNYSNVQEVKAHSHLLSTSQQRALEYRFKYVEELFDDERSVKYNTCISNTFLLNACNYWSIDDNLVKALCTCGKAPGHQQHTCHHPLFCSYCAQTQYNKLTKEVNLHDAGLTYKFVTFVLPEVGMTDAAAKHFFLNCNRLLARLMRNGRITGYIAAEEIYLSNIVHEQGLFHLHCILAVDPERWESTEELIFTALQDVYVGITDIYNIQELFHYFTKSSQLLKAYRGQWQPSNAVSFNAHFKNCVEAMIAFSLNRHRIRVAGSLKYANRTHTRYPARPGPTFLTKSLPVKDERGLIESMIEDFIAGFKHEARLPIDSKGEAMLKRAYDQLQQPAPMLPEKKKSETPSWLMPALGAGALGLGAYAMSHGQPLATPPSTTSPTTPPVPAQANGPLPAAHIPYLQQQLNLGNQRAAFDFNAPKPPSAAVQMASQAQTNVIHADMALLGGMGIRNMFKGNAAPATGPLAKMVANNTLSRVGSGATSAVDAFRLQDALKDVGAGTGTQIAAPVADLAYQLATLYKIPLNYATKLLVGKMVTPYAAESLASATAARHAANPAGSWGDSLKNWGSGAASAAMGEAGTYLSGINTATDNLVDNAHLQGMGEELAHQFTQGTQVSQASNDPARLGTFWKILAKHPTTANSVIEALSKQNPGLARNFLEQYTQLQQGTPN